MNELYKVTRISKTVKIAANGQVIDSYQVDYETKSGIAGSVTVPETEFSKENVASLITPQAQQLEDVLRL